MPRGRLLVNPRQIPISQRLFILQVSNSDECRATPTLSKATVTTGSTPSRFASLLATEILITLEDVLMKPGKTRAQTADITRLGRKNHVFHLSQRSKSADSRVKSHVTPFAKILVEQAVVNVAQQLQVRLPGENKRPETLMQPPGVPSKNVGNVKSLTAINSKSPVSVLTMTVLESAANQTGTPFDQTLARVDSEIRNISRNNPQLSRLSLQENDHSSRVVSRNMTKSESSLYRRNPSATHTTGLSVPEGLRAEGIQVPSNEPVFREEDKPCSKLLRFLRDSRNLNTSTKQRLRKLIAEELASLTSLHRLRLANEQQSDSTSYTIENDVLEDLLSSKLSEVFQEVEETDADALEDILVERLQEAVRDITHENKGSEESPGSERRDLFHLGGHVGRDEIESMFSRICSHLALEMEPEIPPATPVEKETAAFAHLKELTPAFDAIMSAYSCTSDMNLLSADVGVQCHQGGSQDFSTQSGTEQSDHAVCLALIKNIAAEVEKAQEHVLSEVNGPKKSMTKLNWEERIPLEVLQKVSRKYRLSVDVSFPKGQGSF